ncbi:unnamed protein product [Caretta caretta]
MRRGSPPRTAPLPPQAAHKRPAVPAPWHLSSPRPSRHPPPARDEGALTPRRAPGERPLHQKEAAAAAAGAAVLRRERTRRLPGSMDTNRKNKS